MFENNYTAASMVDIGFILELLFRSYEAYQTNRPVKINYTWCTDIVFSLRSTMGMDIVKKSQIPQLIEPFTRQEFETSYDLPAAVALAERIKYAESRKRFKA